MENGLYERLQMNPIIAAVRDEEKLGQALASPCEVIFLLSGNIFELQNLVSKVKECDKEIYVHMDLLQGAAKDYAALKYIATDIRPHGIITTKSSLIKYANELGLFAIQRLFVIDSLSLDTGIKTTIAHQPKALEIMPGIMPDIITQITKKTSIPVIAGGLVSEKEHIIQGLKAGAIGISTSNEKVWYQ